MRLDESDIEQAVSEGVLSREQSSRLLELAGWRQANGEACGFILLANVGL